MAHLCHRFNHSIKPHCFSQTQPRSLEFVNLTSPVKALFLVQLQSVFKAEALTVILVPGCPSTDVSFVQANTELVLETLSQMDDLEDFLSKDKHADPDFTKKLWAYLTINQLLAER